jgi:hypothetical protein
MNITLVKFPLIAARNSKRADISENSLCQKLTTLSLVCNNLTPLGVKIRAKGAKTFSTPFD